MFQKSRGHGETIAREGTAKAKIEGKYRATTKFQVLLSSAPFLCGLEIPSGYQLEFEIKTMESNEVRQRVVNQENLGRLWRLRPQEAVDRLSRMTEIIVGPDTCIVSVSVFGDEPNLVAPLANAIRKAYEEVRAEIETARIRKASERLTEEIKKQEKEVERARMDMIDWQKKIGITRPGPDGKFPEVSKEDQKEYATAKHRYERSILLLKTVKEHAARCRIDEGVMHMPIELLEEARPPSR